MSVDDRLRKGLARNAAAYEPDVETRLRQVKGTSVRRRRSFSAGRWWIPVTAACAVLGLVLVGIALHLSRPLPAPTPTPPATTQQLTGRLQAVLPDRAGVLRADRLAGSWVLRLRSDGTMHVSAPSTYQGVLSAALFDSTGVAFRTSLFGQDLCSGVPLGVYTWHRVGSKVRFSVSDDRCAGRVAVLTTVSWRLP